MPSIRKKTSNRVKLHDRAKLKKKVHDGRKKKAKLAKKNPQWKSKTPKDPGIPNDFPYKDQILAEVAAQRRIDAEGKQRKKEEKQKAAARAKAIARGEIFEEEEDTRQDDDGDDEEDQPKGKRDLNVGAESIASLSAKTLNTTIKPRPRPVAEPVEVEEEDEEEVPVLVNRDLPNLGSVLDKADVVLQVLDARDPLAFRSSHIEELAKAKAKKVLFVLNKIDACPREALSAWTGQLRTEHPTFLFRSATAFLPEVATSQPQPKSKKGKAKAKADAVGVDSILSCLAHWAKEKISDGPLNVAVVGLANVGKSSLINSLLKRGALPVYTLASSSRGPTTTELPQEVVLEVEEQSITFIDTPGVSYIPEEGAEETVLGEHRARDILLRSKGRIDRLKDTAPPISHIVSRANPEDLMLLYSLPAFAKGDPVAFLSGVSRANQMLKKKGELDLTGAARIILRDWSLGKFIHYTTPPPVHRPSAETEESSTAPQPAKSEFTPSSSYLAQLYAKDEAILAALPTRKEMRKKGGLVKLSTGAVEARKAAVEEDWAGVEDSEDEADDDDEGANDRVEVMDVGSEEEEDEEEGEEEEGEESEEEEADSIMDDEEEEEEPKPVLLSNKQKRKRGLEKAAPGRPAKKVSFAPASSAKDKKKELAQNKKPPRSVQANASPLNKLVEKAENKQASAPSPVKALPKSSLKAAVKKAPPENKGKVANVKPKTKALLAASNGKKDESAPEVYDFGKFF